MRSKKKTLVALFGILSAACGAGSPVAPTPSPSPTPNPRSIALGPGMPASGGTMSVGSCGRGACTHAVDYSFVVRFDVTVRRPVFRVALMTAEGKECLFSYQSDLWPVTAGEPHSFLGDTLLFSTTPAGSADPLHNNCKVPFTTTRIATELHDTDVMGPVLLAQDFAVTYQWTQ